MDEADYKGIQGRFDCLMNAIACVEEDLKEHFAAHDREERKKRCGDHHGHGGRGVRRRLESIEEKIDQIQMHLFGVKEE